MPVAVRKSMDGRSTPPKRRSLRRGPALLAASLGFAVVQLDVSVVNVALPQIGTRLHGGVPAMQWVVNAYTVVLAAAILTAGALGDRVGAKRVFSAGMVVFTLASVTCGIAPGIPTLVAARAVQGLGAALLVPSSLTLVSHLYPEPTERARAVGLWAAGASAALSAGPLVGGVLTATLGWRSIFLINLPLGSLGLWLMTRFAEETAPDKDRGVDVWGQLAAAVGLASLAAAAIEGGSLGFDAPPVIGGFVVALLAGVAFGWLEAARARPMLPLGLFRSPTFRATTAMGLFINVGFYGLIFLFSLFFQRAQHRSAWSTGLAFAPVTAAVLIGNLTASRLLKAAGARRLSVVGTVMMGAACLGLTRVTAAAPYAVVLAPLVALGLGLGLVVPAMTTALLSSVETSYSGVAAGALNTGRQTGSVVGVALFGSLATREGFIPGLRLSLVISAVLVLLAAAWATRIPRGGQDVTSRGASTR